MNIITNRKLYDEKEESLLPRPVSPTSQGLHNSLMTLTILALVEFETPINESETLDFIRNDFVPITPRFSWTIETDKQGVSTWKKVKEIRYEEHLVVPTFPSGLKTREEYDERLKEYISEIGGVRLPEGKPLWEFHLIKYPSLNGVTSLVFKSSHAIGDGYSYFELLFYAFKRAGNQSLPFTFPQVVLRQQNGKATGKGKKFLEFISKAIYSASDVGWSLLKASVMKDPPSAIRSETSSAGLFRPINIYTMTFSLERIKQLKSNLRVTMNDLIMGAISYMIHLYMVRMGQISSNDSSMTILVMINMRVLKGYKTFEEMINAPGSWGNHSQVLLVPIPSFSYSEKMNPLDFIFKAKETMSKKKNSIFIDVLDPLIKMWRVIRGQKGVNESMYSSFSNSSTMITSLIGPVEQMAIGGHPVSSCIFLLTGVPQSLTFTSVSLNGELKLVATMEKGFIDSKIFTSCMNEAFENIFEAAAVASKSTDAIPED